jgi:ribosomal RNA assembly protein
LQQVHIPGERVKALKKEKGALALVERICKCKAAVDGDDVIEIKSDDGSAYSEFTAKNIIFAFGRGFEMKDAERLEHDDCYFEMIDLGALFGSDKRITQMKSRVIGENGRTKVYIEGVSGAKIAVYGETVSLIGTAEQIVEAKTAVEALLQGSTHRVAYAKMEAAHRKHKQQAQGMPFQAAPF